MIDSRLCNRLNQQVLHRRWTAHVATSRPWKQEMDALYMAGTGTGKETVVFQHSGARPINCHVYCIQVPIDLAYC